MGSAINAASLFQTYKVNKLTEICYFREWEAHYALTPGDNITQSFVLGNDVIATAVPYPRNPERM